MSNQPQHLPAPRRRRRGLLTLVTGGAACVALAGVSTMAASALSVSSSSTAMAAGDSQTLTCAGPALAVFQQSPTQVQVHCADYATPPPTTAPPTTVSSTTVPSTTSVPPPPTTTAASTTTVLKTTTTTAPSTVASAVPAGINFGTGYESTFAGQSAGAQQATMTQMANAAITWLRIDSPARLPFDTEARDAQAAGIHPLILIQDWSTADTPSALAALATSEAQHYAPLGIHYYEVLSETNITGMTAQTYTSILQAVYPALKSADPAAFVVAAGLAPAGGSNEPYSYLAAMYAAGAHGYFDAAADHPFSYPDLPSQTNDSWNPWSYLPQLHQIMVSNGDGNKAIWLTEFGAPTDNYSQSFQAQTYAQAFGQAKDLGYAGPLIAFDWTDNSTDGAFGVLDKPALAAITASQP